MDGIGRRAHHQRMNGLRTGVVAVATASAFLWGSTAAFAKGPDQAVVSGPGIDHPITVRAPGTPTIGPDLSALIESSGIMNQLWCGTCGHLTPKAPTKNLGPMYLVRYRVPSLIGGPTRWVKQRVYPFAEPRPVTFVRPGQPFWHQRTAGGWYEGRPGLRDTLVRVGVPRTLPTPPSPIVGDTSATSTGSLALTAGGISILIVIIVGLVILGRGRARTRSAHTPA